MSLLSKLCLNRVLGFKLKKKKSRQKSSLYYVKISLPCFSIQWILLSYELYYTYLERTDFSHRDQYISHIPTKASLWKGETTFSLCLWLWLYLCFYSVPQEVSCRKWVLTIYWMHLSYIYKTYLLHSYIAFWGNIQLNKDNQSHNRKMSLLTLCPLRILWDQLVTLK